MSEQSVVRVVVAGVDAATMAQMATDAGGGLIEAVAIGDMQGARLVKQGAAHFYLGTCWSGGGGALAAATALLGGSKVGIAGTPGMAVTESKINQLLGEGKIAFGFPYEQSKSAIPVIIKAILQQERSKATEGGTHV